MCIGIKLAEKDKNRYWIFNKEVTKEEWDKRFELSVVEKPKKKVCSKCIQDVMHNKKMANKINIEEFAKNIIKTIENRKDRGNIGTITRIYSYCKKQIKQDAKEKEIKE